MASAAGYEDPDGDEWEIINDDGFVHKRKKRSRIVPNATSSSGHTKLEKKHRRERKKRGLLKLREKYLKEISRWEILSNTLKEVEENAQTRLLELYPRTFSDAASSSEQNSTCRRIVDDLFSQVLLQNYFTSSRCTCCWYLTSELYINALEMLGAEGQEAIIRDVWSLCDVAEALCSAHEERLKQQLTNLPIWGQSPHELMAALETTTSIVVAESDMYIRRLWGFPSEYLPNTNGKDMAYEILKLELYVIDIAEKEVHEHRGKAGLVYTQFGYTYSWRSWPVFSCEAWRCAWNMIQNDLVHGWGLEFALGMLVESSVSALGTDQYRNDRPMLQRCSAVAEKSYFKAMGVDLPNPPGS
ncbi:UNVERIFIED_CONTAM: hypothetical protein Scaly_0885500 [Sesamum calycinum]|uniref:Uncharacterized protein n=1 Tax=Sesamum calycinum TaxID=2727403 RepID=A0AAW2QWK8_9LAMI